MDLAWSILYFCLGIGLLVKGSDWMVDASARIAKQFGVSNFIVGLTIVALGTSLPELGAAVTASFYRNSEIILGNIIGSNIANIALILGLAGLVVPIAVRKPIYSRDGTLMLLSALLFYLFCFDGLLEAWEGGVFLFIFLAYLHYFVATKRRFRREFHFRSYLHEYTDVKKREKFDNAPQITKSVKGAFKNHFIGKTISLARDFSKLFGRTEASLKRNWRKLMSRRLALQFLFKQLAIALVGAICIFFGANFVVSNAMQFPISQLSIGLIFVALGTSLPELSVTISSLRKGLPQIMIGNLIGSNIANIFWVGGVSVIISPILVPVSVLVFDFIFLILVTWLFLVFLRNDRKITPLESITMLLLYFVFIAITFGMGLGG